MTLALPPDFGWFAMLVAVSAITLAALVFGATGFGSSMVSVPTLAHVLPLTFVVPLVTAIDLVGVSNATVRQWRQVDWREFGRLLVPAVIGIALGSTFLVRLPRDVALFTLGVFTIAFAIHALAGSRRWRAIRTGWAVPAGVFGGIFSALFGTGGPVYMSYLASRIDEKSSLRATASLMIAAAVFSRVVAYGLSSLWVQPGLATLALVLLPCTLLGYALGSHLHLRLAGATIRRWIALLLLANGVLLILRAIGAMQ